MKDDDWNQSCNENFSIKYNGESVKEHEIDAHDLSKSLLGLSEILENTNQIVHGTNSNISVKVKGSFQAGSFDVDIVSVLVCNHFQAALNVFSLIGIVGSSYKSLIWLFKKTKGETIKSTKLLDNNKVELSFHNCSNIVVDNNIADIYNNDNVRKGFGNLVLPLEDEGMSDITFLKNDVEQEKIKREERSYFYPPEPEQLIEEGEDYFLITQGNFDGEKTGWKLRFTDQIDSIYKQKGFSVRIHDENFLKNVKRKKVQISNDGKIIRASYRKIIKEAEPVSWQILKVYRVMSIGEYSRGGKHHTMNTRLNDF